MLQDQNLLFYLFKVKSWARISIGGSTILSLNTHIEECLKLLFKKKPENSNLSGKIVEKKTYPKWNLIFLIDNSIWFDGFSKGKSAKFGENTTKFVAAFGVQNQFMMWCCT